MKLYTFNPPPKTRKPWKLVVRVKPPHKPSYMWTTNHRSRADALHWLEINKGLYAVAGHKIKKISLKEVADEKTK